MCIINSDRSGHLPRHPNGAVSPLSLEQNTDFKNILATPYLLNPKFRNNKIGPLLLSVFEESAYFGVKTNAIECPCQDQQQTEKRIYYFFSNFDK